MASLPPTWCDRDRLLEHVMIQVLFDYVEKEQPYDHFTTAGCAWYNTALKPHDYSYAPDQQQFEEYKELST